MISSTSFYNSVAKDYNSHQTKSDSYVRNYVMKKFLNNIPHGNILDFGGGTGLDLPWLLIPKYSVNFLEPSSNMKTLAKVAISENLQQPVFIEENIDFHNWSSDSLPFDERMNGILANFAVLNCIKDIGCLFEKMALVCDRDCKVVATVLDTHAIRMLKAYSLKVAIKRFFKRPLVTETKYNYAIQQTYLHTLSNYKSASRKYFNFISYTSIKASPFALLLLSKK
jgi:ubiquinone/menaquinone biosynthesis C-methylase UbiE